MKFVKAFLWQLLDRDDHQKLRRYTFLWGTVNAVSASPETVPQQGLSGGAEALQSSDEMWSQQAWPLDKYLLCLNRPDWRTGAQHAPKFTSSGRNHHYSSQATTNFAHAGLKSQASQQTLMPRTTTLAERSSWWAPHIDPKPWISLSLRAEDPTTFQLGI